MNCARTYAAASLRGEGLQVGKMGGGERKDMGAREEGTDALELG